MNEFAQKFADLTIKMREAEIAKAEAISTRENAKRKRTDLISDTEEFVPGVYDVKNGHVVITDDGNISFYDDNDV